MLVVLALTVKKSKTFPGSSTGACGGGIHARRAVRLDSPAVGGVMALGGTSQRANEEVAG